MAKDNSAMWKGAAIGIVLLIAAVAIFSPDTLKSVGLYNIAGTGGGTNINPTATAAPNVLNDLQSQYTLKVSAQNAEAFGTEFISGSVAATYSGAETSVATATLTGGSSETLASLTVGKGKSGKIYLLGDGTYSGASIDYVASGDLLPFKFVKSGNVKNQAANASYLVMQGYTSTLAADNASTVPQNYGVDYTTLTHTVGQGTHVTGIFDVQVNASQKRWSSGWGGYIIAVGGAGTTPSVFPDAGTVLLTKQSGSMDVTPLVGCVDPNDGYGGRILAKVVSKRSPALACWKINNAAKATDSYSRFAYDLNPTGGNPASGDDVSFYFVDREPFVDSDGLIYVGAYDTNNVDKGVTDSYFKVDLA